MLSGESSHFHSNSFLVFMCHPCATSICFAQCESKEWNFPVVVDMILRRLDRRTCAQGGETPLMWAAEKGHADCARLLLDAGADTNITTSVRRTAPPAVIGHVLVLG